MYRCGDPWFGIIPPPRCPGCLICQPEVNRRLWTREEILEALEKFRELRGKAPKIERCKSCGGYYKWHLDYCDEV